FVPIFAPIVSEIGVHPIHFGTMVVYAFSAGVVTPPVGNVLFVGARIADLEIEPVIRRLLPFLLSIFIGLFVVVFIPQSSLAFPGALEMLCRSGRGGRLTRRRSAESEQHQLLGQ